MVNRILSLAFTRRECWKFDRLRRLGTTSGNRFKEEGQRGEELVHRGEMAVGGSRVYKEPPGQRRTLPFIKTTSDVRGKFPISAAANVLAEHHRLWSSCVPCGRAQIRGGDWAIGVCGKGSWRPPVFGDGSVKRSLGRSKERRLGAGPGAWGRGGLDEESLYVDSWRRLQRPSATISHKKGANWLIQGAPLEKRP